MRRSGLPSSLQLLKVGKATLLHQHSSSKPMAHSGSAPAASINRSRRLFSSRTGGLGRRSSVSPAATSPREGARASPGWSRQRPAFALFLPRRRPRRPSPRSTGCFGGRTPSDSDVAAPQSLSAVLVEGIAGSPGARGFGHQGLHVSGVEVVDGIPHRLLAAAQILRYLRDLLPPRRS